MASHGPAVPRLEPKGEPLWGRNVSQRSIDVDRPNAVAGAHRRAKPKPVAKSDLMPIMALIGAIYGWLLLLLGVVVAVLVLILT